jgi:hypothetical protein
MTHRCFVVNKDIDFPTTEVLLLACFLTRLKSFLTSAFLYKSLEYEFKFNLSSYVKLKASQCLNVSEEMSQQYSDKSRNNVYLTIAVKQHIPGKSHETTYT